MKKKSIQKRFQSENPCPIAELADLIHRQHRNKRLDSNSGGPKFRQNCGRFSLAFDSIRWTVVVKTPPAHDVQGYHNCGTLLRRKNFRDLWQNHLLRPGRLPKKLSRYHPSASQRNAPRSGTWPAGYSWPGIPCRSRVFVVFSKRSVFWYFFVLTLTGQIALFCRFSTLKIIHT